MVKKFKDVFQSLECAPHMDELLNFVSVEKVTASSDMTLIKVNIIAERIIEKRTILELEALIKDKMFPKKNIKIKIFFFSLITSYSVYFILYGYSIVSFKFCQVSFPHSVICNLPLFPFDNFIFLYYNFYK